MVFTVSLPMETTPPVPGPAFQKQESVPSHLVLPVPPSVSAVHPFLVQILSDHPDSTRSHTHAGTEDPGAGATRFLTPLEFHVVIQRRLFLTHGLLFRVIVQHFIHF